VSENFIKLVNIWQSYKQQPGCLVHFVRLANTLLKDEESAQDNHVFACNFGKYSPILKQISLYKSFLNWLLTTLNMQLHYLVLCH